MEDKAERNIVTVTPRFPAQCVRTLLRSFSVRQWVVLCAAAGILTVAVAAHYWILLWLDQAAWRYWVPASLLMSLVVGSAWRATNPRPTGLRWLASGPVFAVLILCTLLAFRWQSIAYNQQLSDPDESQVIAGALTLAHDPAFWRSVDGTTHGPLDAFAFTTPRLLGLPINYTTARLVTIILNWTAILAAWFALRTFVPERMARLAIVPATALYAFSTFDGVIQAGTEDLPATLTAVGLYFGLMASSRLQSGLPCFNGWFAAGSFLGAVPFAKLQGVPPAIWVGSGLFLMAWFSSGGRARWLNLAALCVGALTVTAACFSLLGPAGAIQDFWNAYIVNNLYYVRQRPMTSWAVLEAFPETAKYAPGYRAFFFPLLAVIAVVAGGLVFVRRKAIAPTVLIIGWAIFSVYAMVSPGRDFLHYARLTFVPCAAAAAVLVAIPYARFEEQGRRRSAACLAGLFLFATLFPQIEWRMGHGRTFRGEYKACHRLRVDPSARLIRKHAHPGDRMAQWGWEPNLFVQAQLPQGTREAHTQRQIEPGPQQGYYRTRFLRDMQQNRPRVFIDSVGGDNFAFKDRASQGHEIFPELKALVARNYQLVGDVDGVRVYVLNDR